jgi:hypothetical protein
MLWEGAHEQADTYNGHSNASPFWRTASANSQRDKQQQQQSQPPPSERKVIGASYSHADVLNLNNLYAPYMRRITSTH